MRFRWKIKQSFSINSQTTWVWMSKRLGETVLASWFYKHDNLSSLFVKKTIIEGKNIKVKE